METISSFQKMEILIKHLVELLEINSYLARAYESHMILKAMKVRDRLYLLLLMIIKMRLYISN